MTWHVNERSLIETGDFIVNKMWTMVAMFFSVISVNFGKFGKKETYVIKNSRPASNH